jgi:hypothetical protein
MRLEVRSLMLLLCCVVLWLELRFATATGYVCVYQNNFHFEDLGNVWIILTLQVYTLIANVFCLVAHLTGCLVVIRIRAGRGARTEAMHKSSFPACEGEKGNLVSEKCAARS